MIGDIAPEKGKCKQGKLIAGKHPDGESYYLPLIVMAGAKEGPTLVISANIHGDETAGILVINDLLASIDAHELKGMIIALPSLNPTGMRQSTRHPNFDMRDPNRLLPDFRKAPRQHTDMIVATDMKEYPSLHEVAMQKIYTLIEEHADYYFDLHTARYRSAPLAFMDPVFYHNDKDSAQKLFETTISLANALGLTKVCETPGKEYFERNMHRTTSGAVLNGLRIPAITIELGGNKRIDNDIVKEAVKGFRNALRVMGQLHGSMEKTHYPVKLPDQIYRFISHPRTKYSGILRYVKEEGDFVKAGEAVAKLTDVYGNTVGDGVILSELDGYLMWIEENQVAYPNTSLAMMAIPYEGEFVVKFPE